MKFTGTLSCQTLLCLPEAIKRTSMMKKAPQLGLGKGGVGGSTGKGKPAAGTKVGVGKPGKGGVAVNTGHKGKPVYAGNYGYAATEDQLHDNPNVGLFFLKKDLRASMRLNFTNPTNQTSSLPQKQLLDILSSFSAKPESLGMINVYWKSVLPNTPMPEAIKGMLQPAAYFNDEKGGVGVSTGKGKPAAGTKVGVGKPEKGRSSC